MGSFSWLKADNETQVANIARGKPFKCLIPKEFGGGFIYDSGYQDYGYLVNKETGAKHDMYEILAVWNSNEAPDDGNYLPVINDKTDSARSKGIDIGCYNNEIDKLKYPLKLVSASCNLSYEEVDGRSYRDPNQGWGETPR